MYPQSYSPSLMLNCGIDFYEKITCYITKNGVYGINDIDMYYYFSNLFIELRDNAWKMVIGSCSVVLNRVII